MARLIYARRHFFVLPVHSGISDYEAEHKPYVALEDVQILNNATHARGMRIIFDLVPVIDHSPHLHKRFQESRSSKQNPKRDWYFWRPARIDASARQFGEVIKKDKIYS